MSLSLTATPRVAGSLDLLQAQSVALRVYAGACMRRGVGISEYTSIFMREMGAALRAQYSGRLARGRDRGYRLTLR